MAPGLAGVATPVCVAAKAGGAVADAAVGGGGIGLDTRKCQCISMAWGCQWAILAL